MSRDQLPQVFRTYIPGKPVETDRLLKMKRAVPDELLAIINKMIGDVTHGEMTEILHDRAVHEAECEYTKNAWLRKRFNIRGTNSAIMVFDIIDAMRNNYKPYHHLTVASNEQSPNPQPLSLAW